MLPRHRLRALATALFAASLSFAGPGAVALASAPDALVRDGRSGDAEQPLLARLETTSARLAVRATRSIVDAAARNLVAALPPAIALAPPETARVLGARGAPQTARRVPVTARSSRGPPAA